MDLNLWFLNLVFWSVQVALLILAAGLLPRILKLRQPRVLVAYWRSLLAMSLLLPFVQPWHRPENVAAMVVSSDSVAVPLPPLSTPASPHWHLPSLQTIAPILGIVILVGIAFRLTVFALGLVKLRRLRQASSPIAPSAESVAVLQAARTLVAASAEFRLSAQVDSPVTFGFVAPVVLLPDRFASLEPPSSPRSPATNCFTCAATIGPITLAKKFCERCSGSIPPLPGSSRAPVSHASRSWTWRSSSSQMREKRTSKPCSSSPIAALPWRPFPRRHSSPSVSSSSESYSC